MIGFPAWTKLDRFAERESLRLDLGRGCRAAIAFMVPLFLSVAGWLPMEVSMVALAAQNIAMVDVRGAYQFRLGLLFAMTGVFTLAAALGTLASENIYAAVLATVFIALCGGVWRHLSSDYGMSLAISSTLVFFIALTSADGAAAIERHTIAVLVGGLWGLFLQVAHWPFRPQHPLRRTVADTWVAVADLFEAMAPADQNTEAERQHRVRECEATLRTTLDKTYAMLAASKPGPLRTRLEALNLAGARLATRVVVLNTALETLMGRAEFAAFMPAFQPALTSFTNTSRTVAVTVVSRQASQLAKCEVRLHRLANLLRVLQGRAGTSLHDPAAVAQLREILRQIEQLLPQILEALRATVDRVEERSAFSLELLDIDTWTLRPLASALNLHQRVDPALVRFTARLAVFMAFGVVIFKFFELPHGYWLPFTIVVVLQPDYGSTRQRAAQRVAGTLGGSGLASLLLWLNLPFAALAAAMTVTIFSFGYFLKRNYAVAVLFITLFLVLLTEAERPVTLAFTVERLAATLVGGALALGAALFFWPVWERDRFPPVLARGLRANRDYLRLLVARAASGVSYDAEAIAAKQRAEAANSAVFSSLQRMTGDPRNQREGLERFAMLANGNQRLTRALTVLTLHLTPSAPLTHPELSRFADLASDALEELAKTVEAGRSNHATRQQLFAALENFELPLPPLESTAAGAQRERWIFAQLMRAATELSALLLAAQDEAPSLASGMAAH